MTITYAKSIDLAAFMQQSMGVEPVKVTPSSISFPSPFREERNPSFYVDRTRNLWYDFGLTGAKYSGGSIIELVKVFLNTDDIPTVMHFIESKGGLTAEPWKQPTNLTPQQRNMFSDMSVHALSNGALMNYLKDRAINLAVAKQFCQEAHYTVPSTGRQYFAIAFPNRSGGFELRNRYFKGGTKPKDISVISGRSADKKGCMVFEGFMDMLSFYTMKPDSVCDAIVLNSTSNVRKAELVLREYDRCFLCLDNDEAGDNAVKAVMEMKTEAMIVDARWRYQGFKDFNEYWISINRKNYEKEIK